MSADPSANVDPKPKPPPGLCREPFSEDDFGKWCVELVDYLTPIRERFTPFPRYFEVQAFDFLIMQRLLADYLTVGRKYDSTLEIGCGVGFHSLLLSRFSRHHTGVDMPGHYEGYTPAAFSSSVDIARALVTETFGVSHCEFAEAFPDRLPLPDATVDLLFTWTVVEHIPQLAPAYKDMMRVLKPGGLMLHVVPNVMNWIHQFVADNLTAAKKAPSQVAPLGYLGAARHLWREFLKLARGYEEKPQPGVIIPSCHSEFLSDFSDQIKMYVSWTYLTPLLRLGMTLERLTPINDFMDAAVLRRPAAAAL